MYQNPTFIKNIQISEYDYSLPDERIAKYPLTERDQSKILIYKNGNVEVSEFKKLPELLNPEHLLVFNNTRVIPVNIG